MNSGVYFLLIYYSTIYTIVIHPTTNFIYNGILKPSFVPLLLSIADTAATTIIL